MVKVLFFRFFTSKNSFLIKLITNKLRNKIITNYLITIISCHKNEIINLKYCFLILAVASVYYTSNLF